VAAYQGSSQLPYKAHCCYAQTTTEHDGTSQHCSETNRRNCANKSNAPAACCPVPQEHTALGQKHMDAVRQLEQRAVEAEGRASAAELARHTMEQLAQEREAGLKRAQAQVHLMRASAAHSPRRVAGGQGITACVLSCE
jgi:hypothetical protein